MFWTWLFYAVLFIGGTWALTEAWPLVRRFANGLTRPASQLLAMSLILVLTGWVGGVLILLAMLIGGDND